MNIPEKLYHVTTRTRAEQIINSSTHIKELYFAKHPFWAYAKRKCEEDGDDAACIVLDLSNYDTDYELPFELEYLNEYHEEWVATDIPPEFLEILTEE